jgi:hypothetical protein
MNPPEQEPDNSDHSPSDFEDWQGFHREGESREFASYNDKSDFHNPGSSQEFHYEDNRLPEKD